MPYKKVQQIAVLYEGPNLNRQEFTCGGCMMYLADVGQCEVLDPASVGKDDGCGLWIGGPNHLKSNGAEASYAVPASVAGLGRGPFTCKRCEYFEHPGFQIPGRCDIVEGWVHGNGCCNAWSPREG